MLDTFNRLSTLFQKQINIKQIPMSLHWILKLAIGNNIRTVLDLGCGEGEFMEKIAYRENWQITGVEIFPQAVIRAKKRNIYKKIIIADVTKLPSSIDKKFDLVFCSQVIEHLEKKAGLKCLDSWENLALKKILISTPVGFMKFHRVEMSKREDNSYQKHLSGWTVEEFQSRGYKVYGQGIRFIYGENGLVRKTPVFLWPLLIIISYIFSPIAFFYPRAGTYMIAVKTLGNKA